MAEHAFFPLAIDAYLADCSHLTDAEHGRYLRILMELWRAPHISILERPTKEGTVVTNG